MRTTVMLFAGMVTAFLALPTPVAHASDSDDYVSTVVDALEETSVYIDPGVPGTDADTASELTAKLNQEDNIVLIMLAPEAEAEIDNPSEFLREVSDELGDDDIIGLTIGDEAIAYSEVLPKGVAADLMSRADSVSTNNVEVLNTFTRNVHQYQVDHPQPLDPKDDSDGFIWLLIVLVLIAAAAPIALAIMRALDRRRAVSTPDLPSNLKDYFGKMIAYQREIADPDLKLIVWNSCRDTENYFAKYSINPADDADIFEGYLSGIVDVLDRYIDIQDNPRYYEQPEEDLQMGQRALREFGDHVLQLCKKGTELSYERYSVNTQILQSERSTYNN